MGAGQAHARNYPDTEVCTVPGALLMAAMNDAGKPKGCCGAALHGAAPCLGKHMAYTVIRPS